MSAGFAGGFIRAALLVLAGLRPLVRYVPWAAVAIGIGLVGLGVALLAGHRLALGAGDRLRPGDQRTHRRMAVFGAAYALASLSCTLAAPNWLGTLAVLVAYGAGAATVLTALSVPPTWPRAPGQGPPPGPSAPMSICPVAVGGAGSRLPWSERSLVSAV